LWRKFEKKRTFGALNLRKFWDLRMRFKGLRGIKGFEGDFGRNDRLYYEKY